jgi:hypothetical protein
LLYASSTARSGEVSDFLVRRQEFDHAVQTPGPFEPAHEARLRVEQLDAVAPGNRQRLSLIVVILQHQQTDFVGHIGEQRVALLLSHFTVLHHEAEQNLDVDFVIRTIHAG